MSDSTSNPSYASLAALSARHSLKRARVLYCVDPQSTFLPSTDPAILQASLNRRKRRSAVPVQTKEIKQSDALALLPDDGQHNDNNTIIQMMPVASELSNTSTALTVQGGKSSDGDKSKKATGILVKSDKGGGSGKLKIPTPDWHAPWKLSTVLSSHLGWVRSLAFDPTNDMFASGSADRTIKIWDLAKASVGAPDALKITLTGHISPVRGLAFSPRHPYLFSAGEDKMVKCWDLETNQVIRHYHGHLSGVFCLKLHPTLDLLVTGGRDAVARVWDIRTKTQIHVLAGHDNTVASLLCRSTDPQVITGSHDTTIKLWDLAAGKCMTTLTHHQKSIRAMVEPAFENTFVSGAADCLKYWQAKDGRFLKSYTGHKAVVNAMAVNEDGVLVSGGDDGTMHFWDYKTGYNFQSSTSIVQPGSLDAENAIYCAEFDGTGTRLITGEADKSIKIWKQDEDASELTDPIDMVGWRKKCIKESKQRY
ncbi:serine/threonine protein kinase [Nitzschia inconspicua]|uniref:Serine/threonine protein kinase n=1 Tax=Nitzschia inconspicua TaxID=303405 RepID=A0A9K3Q017_9STRA|nr:serine/threonine protein kinase [Nitzschia inconspicua]